MKKFITLSLLTISVLVTTSLSLAEDIELYVSDAVKQSAKKSKVLIIFDNSGSMGDQHTVDKPYNLDETTPPEDYPPDGPSHAYNDDATYFNKGSTDGFSAIPDSPSDGRRFNLLVNGCESSKESLRMKGYYTGHIREYNLKGNSGSWDEIRNNNGFETISVIDCQEDVRIVEDGIVINAGSTVNAEGHIDGYPADDLSTKKVPVYYTTDASKSDVDWSGPLVTLYTANYLRWYHSLLKDEITETRLDTAIRSITNVIETTDGIEFGLEIFNYNYGDGSSSNNGGRVVFGINEMTATNETSLISLIDNDLTAFTWTPLCESTYEAQQYFAGKTVEYGDDAKSSSRPIADRRITNSSNEYKNPFDECTDKAYIILITDGVPSYDSGADSAIEGLTSKENGVDADGNPELKDVTFTGTHENFNNAPFAYDKKSYNTGSSYLPALAGWMNTYDVNLNLDGVQTVSTHTIGFSEGAADAAPLLIETAKRGGGDYFAASDGLQLTNALLSTLRNLAPANDSLTSASVAANNFDRTETLNSVYYAMFDPQNGPRWQGNLKKYKVIDSVQVGVNDVPALDEDTGHFSTTVQSYWSPTVDGNLVEKGGVASWFATQNVADRVVYSDIGDGGTLARLNTAALTGKEQAFADDLGIALADVTDYFNWNLGMDVDDEDKDGSITDMRTDVFGDPLHSKPLVVNYGGRVYDEDTGTYTGKDDIRIVIGTNAGALHMFEDAGDTVSEKWAFMPKELFPNIAGLRDNYSSASKIYGVDGQITSYVNDKNGDGIIDTGDSVWIFFGLRRGGDSYYALDISTPDSPSIMWHIKGGSTGFEELGQTWSQPKIGFSKLNFSGKVASPVLFFGGGYDTNKDSVGAGTSDNKGRSVYMVDAKTGALKWSMAPSGADTTFAGTDSIPSSIGLLDSNGNGLVDRLYTGDTGGNVWRVDMPDDSIIADFSVFKLASLGGDTDPTDRRFFYEPSIVRTFIAETIETEVTDKDGVTTTITVHQEKPYDAVLIGSGDRSNPLGIDTADSFFMIKDEHIKTQTFSADSTPSTPTVITESNLFNFTTDRFAATMTSEAREILALEVSAQSGWFIDLTQTGEKSTSAAIVINGIAYYTSFTPPEFSADLVDCKPPIGKGWLYAVDLALGTKRYNWLSEDTDNRTDRIALISEQFLGSPTLIVLPDDPDNPKSEVTGNLIVGRKIIGVDFDLKTMRTYLYVTEEQ
ncbi:pilus assembly protein [Colwellia piezophila]|uniref:pilus assembly protein n=1 Tax=Colwellia piezophila TaxID=211668 RepID=UPI000360E8C2|nr:PilC/PilY family type IV pilus protein [Colwellia piezophila]